MKPLAALPMVLLGLVFLTTTTSLHAQRERAIQLSLLTPVQLFPEADAITGVRLNLLYGRNAWVRGLDLGLVNHTTSGTSKGVQFGVQIGIVNYARQLNGLQIGIVNIITKDGAFPVFPIVNWSF